MHKSAVHSYSEPFTWSFSQCRYRWFAWWRIQYCTATVLAFSSGAETCIQGYKQPDITDVTYSGPVRLVWFKLNHFLGHQTVLAHITIGSKTGRPVGSYVFSCQASRLMQEWLRILVKYSAYILVIDWSLFSFFWDVILHIHVYTYHNCAFLVRVQVS